MRVFLSLILIALLAGACARVVPTPEEPGTSKPLVGSIDVLVIAVRFPDVRPRATMAHIRALAARMAEYVSDASYGRVRLKMEVSGWHDMDETMWRYSPGGMPRRFEAEPVKRLIAESLAKARGAFMSGYDMAWVIVGAPGGSEGSFGPMAVAANPGLLSGRARSGIRMEPIPDEGGWAGPSLISTEDAHVGDVGRRMLQAIGGVENYRRRALDLFDGELEQTYFRIPDPAELARFAGPWDVMSQPYLAWEGGPLAPGAFTRIRLGWIRPFQIIDVKPGHTREFTLNPLAAGKGTLAARVPLGGGRYILVENRQPIHHDRSLPSFGMLVSEVDEAKRGGTAIVRVIDANPLTPTILDAPFSPGHSHLDAYRNAKAGVVIVPVQQQFDGDIRVQITTPMGRPSDYRMMPGGS